MPWFKVDDKLHSHPKARRAGLEAMGLWSLAGSYCMDYLTDGVVEAWFVESLPSGAKAAARLVKVGLWDVHPDGWMFHDWDEFQPTRASVIEDREAAAERMRRVRANKPRTNSDGSASPSPVPSPDFYSPSKSQSRDTRARVSTDAIEVSDMTRRLAAQKGITGLRVIVDSVHRHTTATITADHAFQLSTHLLDKAKTWPDNPQRYVLACIRDNPAEVEKHLYEQIGVAS